jgi:hypothetical protein
MPFDTVISVLTFCDSEKMTERYEMMKKALPTLEALSKEPSVFLMLWDNGSSDDVKDYLKSLDFFDFQYFSEHNLYDVPVLRAISETAKILNAKYICHVEDDLELIEPDCISSLKKFLDEHNDVGGIRLLKFDYYNQKKYDKRSPTTDTDRSNFMTLKNIISGNSLDWSDPIKLEKYTFFKVNWHWYNFPIFTRLETFEKVIARGDVEPLQAQEGVMARNFDSLNLKLAILNGGVFNHLGTFNSKGSARLFVRDNLVNQKEVSGQFPRLKDEDITSSVENFKLSLKEFLKK